MSNRPTVVMGDRPGGSSRRRQATERPSARVTVPRIFVFQVPGPVVGGELPPDEAGALVGFGVGLLPGVFEAVSPVTTTHGFEHMFVLNGLARG